MSSARSTKSTQGKAAVPAVGGDLVEVGGLTDMQEAFCLAFTDGPTAGNNRKSAIAAGYSEKTAGPQGVALLKLPQIAAAIDARLRDAIGGSLAASSVQFLRRVLEDETAPMKTRAGVALKLVEFSGLVERAQVAKAKETGLSTDRPLAELSRHELEAVVKAGAAVLKAAATLPGPGQAIEGTVSGVNVLDGVPASGDTDA